MLALTFGSPIEDEDEKESIVTKKVTGKPNRLPDRRESAVCETEK